MGAIRSVLRRGRRASALVMFAYAVLAVIVVLGATPGLLTAHEVGAQDLGARLLPPAWLAGGDWSHPLGTDHLGRDSWARIVYGARVSLLIAAGAVLVAGVIGTTAGLVAGFRGGLVDEVLMRTADVQLSFSPILLLIAIMAVIGQSTRNVIIVLGLVSWVEYARVVRGETLSIRAKEYIEAARAVGGSSLWIMRYHVFRNVVPTLAVVGAVSASQMILNEAALSFLGLGVDPATPSWGSMLNDAQDYFHVAWWNAVFPGLAILLAALSINVVSDDLAARQGRR